MVPSGLGPAPLAGRSPPPARPPGRATLGWRVGPPAGGLATRRRRGPRRTRRRPAVVGLGLDRLALGVLLLARRGLGLVEGAVGALDRLLELAERRGDVRASELLQRLRGESLCELQRGRASAGSTGRPARRVLLGRDDDERAAVELARRLRAVDDFHSHERGLGVAVVAVVDPQPAAAAVLARLRDVAAQLVDDEPDAAGGDAGDPLPGLGVGGAVVVGAEQRVDEEPRDAMSLGSTVARLWTSAWPRSRLAPCAWSVSSRAARRARACRGDRVRRLLAGAGGLLLLGGRGRLGLEVVVGALDRALDELAVQRAVDDDRPARWNSISTPAARAWSTSCR